MPFAPFTACRYDPRVEMSLQWPAEPDYEIVGDTDAAYRKSTAVSRIPHSISYRTFSWVVRARFEKEEKRLHRGPWDKKIKHKYEFLEAQTQEGVAITREVYAKMRTDDLRGAKIVVKLTDEYQGWVKKTKAKMGHKQGFWSAMVTSKLSELSVAMRKIKSHNNHVGTLLMNSS